jgi:tRNA (guanosine-2'-O-)-methyltransferase
MTLLHTIIRRGGKGLLTQKSRPLDLLSSSGGQDSNLRPLAPHASALPGCATTRTGDQKTQFLRSMTGCKFKGISNSKSTDKDFLCTPMTPERREKIETVLARRQDNLTVVLENVFDPHNISAVMRSCDAVGIQEIFVLTNKIPRHKKWGDRSSSSANKWLTVHQFSDLEACHSELRRRYGRILTTHLSSDAVSLYETDLTVPTALVFGNEHAGVSEEFRALADGNFIIPQVGMIQSLNISVACAVTLYEAYRQKLAAGHYAGAKLPTELQTQLAQKWGLYDENDQ